MGTPALGGGCAFHRAGHGLARYRHRQHRPAGDISRSSCLTGRGGLGGQCLPDRAGRNAVAARRARRDRRSSTNLSRRAAAVHIGVAGLRPGVVAAEPAGGADAAGSRRQRHHEREYGAGAVCLSEPHAGPRIRPQRAGGRDRLYLGPHHRVRHPGGRALALAVRRQYSLRPRRHADRDEDLAVDAAGQARLRFSRRHARRRLSRALHHRHRQRGASILARLGCDRTRRRHPARLSADPQALGSSGADVADRPVPAGAVRAVGGDRRLLLRGAGARVRGAAVLFRGRAAALAGRDRLFPDALAAGGRDHGADRRPLVRPFPVGILGGLGLVLLGIGMVLLATPAGDRRAPSTSSGAW